MFGSTGETLGAFRQPILSIKERLQNILVNHGFTLLGDLWQQRGDYRKARWDLAVWGVKAEYGGRPVSICSWWTMTAIVKAGGVNWYDRGGNSLEIFPQDNKTAAGMLKCGKQK
jgi:hypothetical protein